MMFSPSQNQPSGGILGTIRDKFRGDEGQARMYGAGLLLSQLGAGQAADLSPAHAMLNERRSARQLRDQMSGGEYMDRFTPEEQAFLSTLPASAAQQLIAQRIFAQPAPVDPVQVNGQLVNPQTGEVIGDYRTPETPDPGYRLLTPEETAGIPGIDPSRAYQISPDNRITAIGGDGQTINVDTGANAPQMGTVPQGFVAIQDPEAEGGWRMVRIQGGPEDTSAADANRSTDAATGAVNVLESVEDLRAAVETNPNTTTGFWGSVLGGIPGSGAYDTRMISNEIRGNLAFDQLQAMPVASPTGGALGAVSAPELALLESTVANLDLNGSPEAVMRSLARVEREYTRLLRKAYATSDSPDALDALFGGRPTFITEGGAVTTDMTDEQLLELYRGGQ